MVALGGWAVSYERGTPVQNIGGVAVSYERGTPAQDIAAIRSHGAIVAMLKAEARSPLSLSLPLPL